MRTLQTALSRILGLATGAMIAGIPIAAGVVSSGADDELGTLNLITPEHRVRAAGLVSRGLSVSLSHDYLKERAADEGCVRLGITTPKQGIVTRGILMDIARLKGVAYLEPGTPIYVEDLEAWEAEAGITVGPGWEFMFVAAPLAVPGSTGSPLHPLAIF